MRPALMDVNTLIALLDPDHIEHKTMQKWFTRHHMSGWATCPITENGMVRVFSQAAYPGGQRAPAEVIQILSELKKSFAKSYQFWPDDISLTDNSIFEKSLIAGTRQVTDLYLLALAAPH
jgi:toxin-antitoxin system PIN domain toxin